MNIITILIYTLVFSLSLGQFGKLSPIAGVNIYAHDWVILIILIFSLAQSFIKKKFKPPSLTWPILIFTFAAIASLANSFFYHQPKEVFIGSLYLWRWLAYTGVYFVLSQPHLVSNKQKQHIVSALIATGFITAVIGLLQYILLPDTRFLFSLHWDRHFYRLIGPFLDPNFTGIILALTIILIINKYFLIKLTHQHRVLTNKYPVFNFFKNLTVHITHYFLLIISFSAFMLTYSRSSYLSLVAGLGVIGLFKKQYKAIAVYIAAIFITALILPRPGGEGVRLERTQSTINRIETSQNTLQLIKVKPLLGVGFNLLRYEKHNQNMLGKDWKITHAGAGTDNSLLFLLATTGVVGLIAYLWLIKSQFSLSIKNKNLNFTASLAAVIVHAQFNNTLFYAPVMLWLWILLGKGTTLKK